MKDNNKTILVFTGDIVSIQRVKAELEAKGIYCIIKDGYKQGIEAGFMGGTPSTINLFVLESDVESAMEIIKTSPNSNEE